MFNVFCVKAQSHFCTRSHSFLRISSNSGWHKSPFNTSLGNSAKLGSKHFEHCKLAEKNLKTTSIFGFKAYSKNLQAQRQRCCTLFCTLMMTVADNAQLLLEFCSCRELEKVQSVTARSMMKARSRMFCNTSEHSVPKEREKNIFAG